MRSQRFAALPALALLIACGGGGGAEGVAANGGAAPVVLSPVSSEQGDPGIPVLQWTKATYVEATDRLIVSSRTATGAQPIRIVLPRNFTPPQVLPQGFRAYGVGDMEAVRGVTGSGAGTTYASRLITHGMERGHERLTDTVLPTAGRATYFGTYAGVLGDPEDNRFEDLGLIRGNAQLTADFGAGTFSGRIADRIDSNRQNYDPVDLTETTIDLVNGSVGGPTSGGLASDLGYTGVRGSYTGLFVGSDGQEVVGGMTLTHTRSGRPRFVEYGGFVASQ
jgi:hypothetical protein